MKLLYNVCKNGLLSSFLIMILLFVGCGKQHKRVEDMSFQELKEKALLALKEQKKENAMLYLEHIVTNHPDRPTIGLYRLMLADLYFTAERYPEAYELYAHFAEFYPGDKKAEYAAYRAILTKYYQTLRPECDSGLTEETIQLCKNYRTNPDYGAYRDDIVNVEHTCVRKLIDKEVYVYDFYLHRGKVKSAQKRLDFLREQYLDKDPDLEPQLLYLEGKLAQRMGERGLVEEKLVILTGKYPASPFTRMARSLIKSRDTFLF